MNVNNITQLINDEGRACPNQFVIKTDDGQTIFQSYETKIAIIKNGKVQLNRLDWAYSRTTLKHLYIFLRKWGWEVYSKKDVDKLLAKKTFTTFN